MAEGRIRIRIRKGENSRKKIAELVDALSSSTEVCAIADRSEYATAPTHIFGRRDLPSSSSNGTAEAAESYRSARRGRLEQLQSECRTEEVYEIEKSREHWTEVGRASSEEELLVVHNRQHFQRLMDEWPRDFWYSNGVREKFFVDYGDALELGQKIAEGGQAELFEATIDCRPYVVKVFKGCRVADLERHWTIKQTDSDRFRFAHSGESKLFQNCCYMVGGTLLKDGRFGFVMERYWGDLRKLIDLRMKERSHRGPPFRYPLPILRAIAAGMLNLHTRGILHRDLKASNVLLDMTTDSVKGFGESAGFCSSGCLIADFETSTGVQGTGYWRAPEVLLALKDRNSNPGIWPEKADVYGYAMTSYEVLTGCIPFGELQQLGRKGYDVVIRGERPPLPAYIDDDIQEIIRMCWHSEPLKRPTFEEIVGRLEAARKREVAREVEAAETRLGPDRYAARKLKASQWILKTAKTRWVATRLEPDQEAAWLEWMTAINNCELAQWKWWAAVKKCKMTVGERDALERERDAFEWECDAAARECDAAERKCDAGGRELHAAKKKGEAARKGRKAARKEREEAWKELTAVARREWIRAKLNWDRAKRKADHTDFV